MNKEKIVELFGFLTESEDQIDWKLVVKKGKCPYLGRRCKKGRKSQPDVCIGTCTVLHGKKKSQVIICPHRLTERKQVFTDCIFLLTLHEPGNEFHVVPEINVPGGSVDYVLASVRNGHVKDFVGIELQTLDTTGTIWPSRQLFLREKGVAVSEGDITLKAFGMNWKMTAKTTLPQLHHKIETFEKLNKRLVLVIQDYLMDDMRTKFSFEHLVNARLGDSMHFHSYSLVSIGNKMRLDLKERLSTDSSGIAKCLRLKVDPAIELENIVARIETKLSASTLLTV